MSTQVPDNFFYTDVNNETQVCVVTENEVWTTDYTTFVAWMETRKFAWVKSDDIDVIPDHGRLPLVTFTGNIVGVHTD